MYKCTERTVRATVYTWRSNIVNESDKRNPFLIKKKPKQCVYYILENGPLSKEPRGIAVMADESHSAITYLWPLTKIKQK